jgi:hypothetical protein
VTRVLVCGSRDYADVGQLTTTLEAVHAVYGITVIIEGEAAGADTLAKSWAEDRLGPDAVEKYPADWKQYGRAAGAIRNSQMLIDGKPDLVIAFVSKPLSKSTGTENMVRKARAAKIRTIVIGEDDTGFIRAGSSAVPLPYQIEEEELPG